MIPVVFIHRGNQDYLNVALCQARAWNPTVVLLGDDSNKQLDFERYPFDDFFVEAQRFGPYYQHMSTNPAAFELFCIQRWLILKEFMAHRSYSHIFYCDSDVMLYCDVDQERWSLGVAAYAMAREQLNYRWSAAAHVSYWTKPGIDQFCDFIFHTYAKQIGKLGEKWAWHQRTNTPGGVCDMTLLWLFSRDKCVTNLARVRGDSVFDDNINVSENWLPSEYRMKAGVKEVIWRRNQPYGFNLGLGKWIRFNALHFQGGAKKLLGSYTKEKYDNP